MPPDPYAHTLPNRPPDDWEPLFTPWHDRPGRDPAAACSGRNAAPCKHCQHLAPQHGHLNKVAHLASRFAAEMFPPGPDRDAAKQWGYLAGLWHDLGKFAPDWQEYLNRKADPHQTDATGTVDHSTAGAKHSVHAVSVIGHLLAFAIAGHHAGLLDAISENACLEKRLASQIPTTDHAPPEALKLPAPDLPPFLSVNLCAGNLASV